MQKMLDCSTLHKYLRNCFLKIKDLLNRELLTIDTVMGVLCRLIGDQRKLYQSLTASDYYFKDFKEDDITFDDIAAKRIVSNEVVFLRNLKGSEDKNSFNGMAKTDHAIFNSKYSTEFWGVLALTFDELVDFIINDNYKIDAKMDLDPLSIIYRFKELKKREVEYSIKYKDASDILQSKFSYVNSKGKPKGYEQKKTDKLTILPMYCSALYLQLERLEQKFDMTTAKSKTGKITAISKNGFTTKDFMKVHGEVKKVYGNPYKLNKASGKLIINLNINRDKARELKQLIENAGVSAFPLGKKGLAYVSKIKL